LLIFWIKDESFGITCGEGHPKKGDSIYDQGTIKGFFKLKIACYKIARY
jgi:hypothetical protein